MSYNGGRITDCAGNTFYEISMDLTMTRRILRFLEELPVTVIVDDGKMFYVGIIRCNVQRSVTWRIGLHFPL